VYGYFLCVTPSYVTAVEIQEGTLMSVRHIEMSAPLEWQPATAFRVVRRLQETRRDAYRAASRYPAEGRRSRDHPHPARLPSS
jgi:hypothetical protein